MTADTKAADTKAKSALRAHLTPEQRKCYRHGFFYVRTNLNTLYVLTDGVRVYRLDATGYPLAVHEAYPILHRPVPFQSPLPAFPSALPVDDSLLAQKLLLETNEALFLSIACCMAYAHSLYGSVVPPELETKKYFHLAPGPREVSGEPLAPTTAARLNPAFIPTL